MESGFRCLLGFVFVCGGGVGGSLLHHLVGLFVSPRGRGLVLFIVDVAGHVSV